MQELQMMQYWKFNRQNTAPYQLHLFMFTQITTIMTLKAWIRKSKVILASHLKTVFIVTQTEKQRFFFLQDHHAHPYHLSLNVRACTCFWQHWTVNKRVPLTQWQFTHQTDFVSAKMHHDDKHWCEEKVRKPRGPTRQGCQVNHQ